MNWLVYGALVVVGIVIGVGGTNLYAKKVDPECTADIVQQLKADLKATKDKLTGGQSQPSN